MLEVQSEYTDFNKTDFYISSNNFAQCNILLLEVGHSKQFSKKMVLHTKINFQMILILFLKNPRSCGA